jgi:Tol biopolymer transport system component
MIAACAVALLLASSALAAYVQQKHQARSTRPALVPGARQLWTATGDVTYSSISPDGRFVAFVRSERNRSPALVIHDFNNGSDLRLTDAESKGSPGRAIFSPDSQRVAFNWTNGGLDEIRVIDLSGRTPSAPRVMVSQQAQTPTIWPGDWSSDGKWIAAIAFKKDRTGQIALISVDDGTIHSLKSVDYGRLWSFDSSHLYFSRDSRYLAYSRLDPKSWTSTAWLLAVEGGHETAAVVHPANDLPAGWTPDGSRLLFMRNRNRALGLWAQPIENGRPKGDSESILPSFGPNHVYSYLGLSRNGDVFFSTAARETRIAIAAFDSRSGKVSVKKEVIGGVQHDWSPDGRSLAYRDAKGPSDPSGHTLTIQSFGRGPNRVLRPQLLSWNWPRWSPDMRAFLVHGTDEKGRQGIYHIDATTSKVHAIALAGSGERFGFPQWFPDGHRIVYTRNTRSGEGRPTAIVERTLASGQERILIESLGLSDDCVLSPDGRFVAYIVTDQARNRSFLEIAALDGSERRELVALQAGASLGGWTRDSKSLVYSGSAPAAPSSNDVKPAALETWLVSLDGSQARRVELPDRLAQLARVSPDGKQIAFLIPNQSPEQVWVIDNLQARTAGR